MRLLNIIAVSLGILLLLAIPAVAAGSPFSVSGQVIDRYGNPLPGANVTLIDNSHKVICTKLTNENGNYDFVNVLSDTDTVTVRVSYTANNTTYEVPSYYTKWYPAMGMQFVPSKETQLPSYPAPVYGYVYGAIQTDISSSARFINGVVYLVSLDNEVKYYEFATRTDGKGSFTFLVPPGNYTLYAQHFENGHIFESARKIVTVTPDTDVADVLPTPIILPLNVISTNPDPATQPVTRQNKVSGTVKTSDGEPMVGSTVTLYERYDNGTGFIKTGDSAITDASGYYEFDGVAPTTDDNKAIQAKKDIVVGVDYAGTGGVTQTEFSEPKPLYYPDMLMGYGADDRARNVTMPTVTMPVAAATPHPPPPSGQNESTPVPIQHNALFICAALVVGLVCIISTYLILRRMG